MNPTEQELISISREIGGIASSNGLFTDGLSCIIEATGRSIPDLTIAELLHLTRSYKQTFNQIHGN
ncbi:MAG: hypothetical protein ACOYL3_22875 [Desulfuromonadaceae bacterium]